METFEINAELRSDVGKGASRRLRHAGRIPAVMYGGGQDPVSLVLDHNDLWLHLQNEAFYSHILELKLGGETHSVVLKDLQRHPAKRVVTHADFLRVQAGETLRMSIPLHFTGEDQAPGVRLNKGIVTHHMNDVVVECLPKNLPEYIEVDVSNLEMGDVLRMTDLKLPQGAAIVDLLGIADMDEETLAANNQAVVSIQQAALEEREEVEPTEAGLQPDTEEGAPGAEEEGEGEGEGD